MENHRDVFQPGRAFFHQPCARQRRARASAHRLGVADIDHLVLPVAAVDDHVVQAALA
jgi:hypothetical protein